MQDFLIKHQMPNVSLQHAQSCCSDYKIYMEFEIQDKERINSFNKSKIGKPQKCA